MDVSIFIRSFNEAALIGQCLEKIFSQQTNLSVEVIVLDSGSTDTTVDIAKRFPVRLFRIPKEKFHYARALNFGVAQATGDLFVSLSAHAVPVDDQWLNELTAPLYSADRVALAYSRQVPWPDVSFPEYAAIGREFPGKDSTIDIERVRLALAEGGSIYETAKSSNVSACYRRKSLLEKGFRSIPFSEDRFAALEALLDGHAVHYASRSQVFHSHIPAYRDFYSIAMKALPARLAIETFGRSALWAKDCKARVPSYGVATIKCAVLAPMIPMLALFALCFPGRKERLREVRYHIASLGTSLGKREAVRRIEKKPVDFDPPVADASEILASVTEVQS